MGMEVPGPVAKGLDRYYHAVNSLGLSGHLPVDKLYSLYRTPCEKSREFPFHEKERLNPFGHGQGNHPVGNILEKFRSQPFAPNGEPLRMATRAQHSDLTTIPHEKLCFAFTTYDPGEPVLKDSALEILLHSIPHNRPQRTVRSLELFL